MKFEIYKDAQKCWRWRLVADNGRTIADSGEGYENRSHAIAMVGSIVERAKQGNYRIIYEGKK
jgi:uncharacterized protein YegP (UPF0339 family)